MAELTRGDGLVKRPPYGRVAGEREPEPISETLRAKVTEPREKRVTPSSRSASSNGSTGDSKTTQCGPTDPQSDLMDTLDVVTIIHWAPAA